MKVTSEGHTVIEQKAEKFLALVGQGAAPPDAAHQVGASLAQLRKAGALAEACREVIDRAGEWMDKPSRERVRKARLLELMMQDDDARVALGAIKADQTECGVSVPGTAVQVNVGVLNERVAKILESLQVEVEGGERGDGGEGRRNP